jgi:hypothetical protein
MKRLVINSVLYPAILLILMASRSFAPTPLEDVTISSDTTWPAGTYQLNSLTVTNSAKLTLQGANQTGQVGGQWAGQGVTISAVNVTVNTGSSITADDQGYTGGATGQAGNGPGGGCGSIGYDSAGGSHGGVGTGTGSCGPGPIYGSPLMPTDLGSGGGGTSISAGGSTYGPRVGGNGGGAIRLIVTGTLTNNGSISANGKSGPGNWPPSLDNYAGGGSGGSIWATVGTLTGSGVFTANGGPRYWGDLPTGPAGGGGRIAVYYANGNSFTGFDISTATGGPGAQKGTVCFINTTENNLLVAGGQILVLGENSSLTFHDIEVRNGANLLIGGGSRIDADGTVTVTGNATIILQGKNSTGQVGGQWVGQGVTLFAANVQLDPGSSITAEGQGYTGGATGQAGNGPGGGGGSMLYDSAGGSYGGAGTGTGSCSPGPIYGVALMPADLGSGGGGTTTSAGGSGYGSCVGGNGGGAIRLIVPGTLTNNGTISANGKSGPGNWPPSLDNYAGGGSGGSIWAAIGTLNGSGVLTANGGSRYWGDLPTGPAGGGGRIAIYYRENSGFNPNSILANGGVGAQAGTVTFEQSTYGDFNKNGKSDIVWRNLSTGDINVWFLNGATVTGDAWLPRVTDQNWQIAGIGDFNGDGRADVVWRHSVSGDINLWFMNGVGVTSDAWLPRVTDVQWQIAGIGDFNKDGKADIVWRNSSTGDINVWFMNGSTISSDAWLPRVTDQNWQIAGIGDFNEDGGGDIVWRYLPSGDLDLWLMNGATVTSDAWLPRVADPQWQINTIGDFNGDGNAEIVWRHTALGDMNIWFMSGASFASDGWLPRVSNQQWKIFGPR